MNALAWLILDFITIACLAFYSMLEMAIVSFNRVRLHYYVSKGYLPAIQINSLLKQPFRLFGTTLIGVNVALVVGSECAREFYSALGISPDWSPISQVILVVLFGELAPMFAARIYAEHVGMAGIGLVYNSAKLMTPLLWIFGYISKLTTWIFGTHHKGGKTHLTQEELQKVMGDLAEETRQKGQMSDFDMVTSNIFRLRHQRLIQLIEPLQLLPKLSSNSTVSEMRQLLHQRDVEYIPIFQKKFTNIIGIAYPRDYARAHDNHRVRDYASSPWFVTRNSRIPQLLEQFKRNKERLAVVLDEQGRALGLVALQDILEEIFGKAALPIEEKQQKLIIDRTFPGNMTVKKFQELYGLRLYEEDGITLSQLMTYLLGRHPELGDTVYLPFFELIVKETSLLDVKTVTIKTRV